MHEISSSVPISVAKYGSSVNKRNKQTLISLRRDNTTHKFFAVHSTFVVGNNINSAKHTFFLQNTSYSSIRLPGRDRAVSTKKQLLD